MARIPILRFSSLETHARQLNLTSYYPVMTLPGLVHGVDNLRHDVYLSPKFCDEARAYIGEVLAGGITKAMTVDIKVAAPAGKLDRAGLLVVNPPFGFEAVMRDAAHSIAPRLEGKISLAWVAGGE